MERGGYGGGWGHGGDAFVWIEPGVFQMGAPESEINESDCIFCDVDDEGPVHEVEISQGFWLGTYEVTQGEWEAVMGTTPWSGESRVQEHPSHPAVYISWDDVQGFCCQAERCGGRGRVSVTFGGGVGVCLSGGDADSLVLWGRCERIDALCVVSCECLECG